MFKIVKPQRALRKNLLYFAIILITAMLCMGAAHADPWIGISFTPRLNTQSNQHKFTKEFTELVKTLKQNHINTIVFDMNYGAYHFTCTPRLKTAVYSHDGGFTFLEARQMAAIARENGMHLIVALQVLTHSVGNVFPYAYPQYMLAARQWQEGKNYSAATDFVQYEGVTYKCLLAHVSTADNAPRPGSAFWVAEPTDTRDPFNREGEAIVYKMVDELIEAFTVDGVKPDAFHLGCDEVGWWYENPKQETGMTSAQIYAMGVSRAYQHIKEKNPTMEVIMWGDMLDPNWNGGKAGKNTSAAVDLLPKNIIVADWRYAATQEFGYEPVREIFPSVGWFINKGFRVWPTSWADVKGATDLVWTGTIEQGRTGKVVGHLYSTWLTGVVPELKKLLGEPKYQVPDSVLMGIDDRDKPRYRSYYRAVADSVKATSHLILAKQCRGTDYNCGIYPDCRDNTMRNGFYDKEFRNYYCSNNRSLHTVIHEPNDYVGYWKFNGNVADAAGKNNGTLSRGAAIVNDPERGKVMSTLAKNGYVRIGNNESLNMGKESMSVSVWFKAGQAKGMETILSKSPSLTSYSLLLDAAGKILFLTNGNNFYRYSMTGKSYRDSRWHHAVAVYDIKKQKIDIYMDGEVSDGTSMFLDGSNNKSSGFDLLIGSNNGAGQYEFRGSLDDVMIFKRSLSPGEIKLLYLTQKPSAAESAAGTGRRKSRRNGI